MIYQKVSPGAKTSEFAYELTPAKMRANVHQVSVEFSNGASGISGGETFTPLFSGWQGDL